MRFISQAILYHLGTFDLGKNDANPLKNTVKDWYKSGRKVFEKTQLKIGVKKENDAKVNTSSRKKKWISII